MGPPCWCTSGVCVNGISPPHLECRAASQEPLNVTSQREDWQRGLGHALRRLRAHRSKSFWSALPFGARTRFAKAAFLRCPVTGLWLLRLPCLSRIAPACA